MGRKGHTKDFIIGHLENEEAMLSNMRFYPLAELVSIGSCHVYPVVKKMLKNGALYLAAGPSPKQNFGLRTCVSINDIDFPPQGRGTGFLPEVDKNGILQPGRPGLYEQIEKVLADSER